MSANTSAEAIGRSITELMSWLTGPDSGQNDGLVTAANQLAALVDERDGKAQEAWQALDMWKKAAADRDRLAAERDALRGERDSILQEAMAETDRLKSDRDRLAAENARLRELVDRAACCMSSAYKSWHADARAALAGDTP